MTVTADARSRTLTIASVPSGHVYVRHLAPEDGTGPVRLPDPPPSGVPADSQQWWPPAMLDTAWIERHAHEVDVFHLHFGFDALEPSDLERLVADLRRHETPLLYTVHDLRNPHHPDRTAHDRLLDVLVPSADGLVTLTSGAADEIERRWGRRPVVVPHPHVVPLDVMQTAAARRARTAHDSPFRVGLHLKSLRASMAPADVLPVLAETVAGLPGAVLQVNAHRDVLEPGGRRYDAPLADLVRTLAAAGRLELQVHDYFSDDDLFAYLGALDVSVLPYRFGTHSGWLEACRDLGTTVVAPTCGYFADQGPVLSYGHDEDGLDATSLADAVRRAHDERPRLGATVAERRTQRAHVAAAHDAVYAGLAGRTGAVA